MASNIPEVTYCCEICGLESLNEEEFRVHTHTAHVDGHAVCPFCQLGAVSPSELLLHVNQAHLDFLTPESELTMSFIDDTSPSEYNGINGVNGVNGVNGECSRDWNLPSLSNGRYSSSSNSNGSSISNNINNINLTPKHSLVNGGGELSPKNSHGHGSPLRSSLNLKLKNSAPTLQCPMCNYTSGSPTELEEHINR